MLFSTKSVLLIWFFIPASLLGRLLCLLHKSRHGRRVSLLRETALFLFYLYVIFLLSVTMNWRRILRLDFSAGTAYNLRLFQGIAEVLETKNFSYIFANIIGNIILFVPLGFFPPLLWRKWRRCSRTLATGLLVSAIIEAVQFVTGRSTDIDDILLNTVGALAGFILFHHLRRAALVIGQSPAAAPGRLGLHRQQRPPFAPAAALLLCGILVSSAILLGGVRPRRLLGPGGAPAAPARNTGAAPASRQIMAFPQPAEGESALHSHSALLLPTNGSRPLIDYHGNTQIYPASLTKIMTALVAIEQLTDTNETVLLKDGIFTKALRENAATAGFLPGEQVTVMDLLYGLLLPSGAECALGLAEHIAGSEEAFVQLMNQKAVDLGMDGTRFANATGLHHPGHYATAKDIAVLLAYALNNSLFEEIFTSSRHSTAPTNLHPEGITLYSTLFTRIDRDEIPGVFILGGKTGYTHEAGQCLASLAEIDGKQYILVTTGAYPEDTTTQSLHIDDAGRVYTAILQGLLKPS